MRWVRLGTLLMLALVVTGCGGDVATPEPTAVPTVVPTATQDQISLAQVVWATAVDPATGAPVDQLAALPNTTPQVVAAVDAGTLPAGVTFKASWTIDGDPLSGIDTQPVVVDAPRERAWVTWTLTWQSDRPWPLGTLGITIEANGEVRTSGEIPIVRAGE